MPDAATLWPSLVLLLVVGCGGSELQAREVERTPSPERRAVERDEQDGGAAAPGAPTVCEREVRSGEGPDSTTRVTRFGFDEDGRLVSVESLRDDRRFSVGSVAYDDEGRPASQHTTYTPGGLPTELHVELEYERGADGFLFQRALTEGPSLAPLSARWVTDAAGRLAMVQQHQMEDVVHRTITCAYDDEGRIARGA